MSLIDQHIREQLKDFNPPVPPHIWENIRAERERRRRFLGFWNQRTQSVAILLLLLLMGGGLYYFQKKKSENSTNSNVDGPAAKTMIGKTPAMEGLKKEGASVAQNNEPPRQNSVDSFTRADRLKNEINSNQRKIQLNTPPTLDSDPVVSANVSLHKKTLQKDRMTEVELSQSETSQASQKEDQEPERGNKSRKYRKNNMNEKGDKMVPLEAVQRIQENQVEDVESKENERACRIAPISKRTQHEIVFHIIPRKLTFTNIPCPSADGPAKKYFEFYAAPDVTFRSYRDTFNSAYLQKRKEATTTIFAFSAGARMNKVYNNGISLQAGLNYSHVIEKFRLVEGNVIQQVFVLNANGDTIGNYMTVGTRYRSSFNHYHTLDIPLMAGYEWGNNKWQLAIHGGAVVNLYSWQKGYMLDSALKAVSISTGDAPSPYQFKSNIGLGLAGSATLFFNMKEYAQFFLEPYFRYNLSTVNKEAITLRQKLHSAGIRVGFRFQF